MFSVIIPLYNKEKYIDKAIDSVLKQTFKDFELIIVNDGSTDNSLSKTQLFNDSRIQIINQENQGVSIARNNGVKISKYHYIAFLDADDWWDCNFLNEISTLIINYPRAAMFASNYYSIKNGKCIPANIGIEKGFSAGYINYFQVYANTLWAPLNCSYIVLDKTIFKNYGGFNENLKIGEDFHLWVKIALKHKVAYLNQFLAYSNQDVSSDNRATGNFKAYNEIYDKSEFFAFNLSFLEEEEKRDVDLKRLLDSIKVTSLVSYYMSGKYKSEVNDILAKVNFNRQSKFYRFTYKYPIVIVKFVYYLKEKGAIIKKIVRRFM